MQLTRGTDYALRTLIQLACFPDRRQSVDDICRVFGTSRSLLTKVVHRLGQQGYLMTSRGKNGGLELARPADEISVGAVVRDIEPHMNLLECFDREHNTCPVVGACRLQGAMYRARQAFLAELDALSIADVSHNRDELIGKLMPQQPADTSEA